MYISHPITPPSPGWCGGCASGAARRAYDYGVAGQQT